MSPKPSVAPRFTPSRKRAVGIVRVSELAGREGESFRSPGDQRAIIERTAEQQGWRLVATFEELDVSAYTRDLNQRPGLGPAVAMIEAGEADVIIGPYFDRLFRNIKYQITTLERIEAAGGSVLASDVGEVRTDTASRWLTSSMLGLISEYLTKLTAEKTQEAKVKAIAAGIPIMPNNAIPFGYRKDPVTRHLVVQEDEAEVVREAFRMREADATLESIRDFLHAHGGKMKGIRGVQNLLKQRAYLGELHFGKLTNLHAHEAIVDPGLFRTVQGKRVARDQKRTASELLLARLGIARCASCGNALVVGSQWQTRANGEKRQYTDYRCSNMGDCKDRVVVSSPLLDEAVIRYIKALDAEGHASASEELDAAERTYLQAEEQLSAMVELLDGLGDLAATRKKLDDLKAKREETFEHWQSLRALHGTKGIRASDWDELSINAQRALIRGRIRTVLVTRSTSKVHSPDRILIQPFTQ